MMRKWTMAMLAVVLAAAPAQAQRVVETPPDPYVHAETGFAFPAALGPFERVAVTEYNADATDVGATYDLRIAGNSVALVSVYVYPLPGGPGPDETARCAGYFGEAKQVIVDRFAGARLIREDSRPAPDADADVAGSHATFAVITDFFAPAGAVESSLTLYCPAGTGWQVKYRTSIPADGAQRAAVEQLIRALEWPTKLGG